MSNRLSNGESRESLSAVMQYLADNGTLALGDSGKNIVVLKNGELIINNKFDVVAFDCNNYMLVDIMWEDAGYSNYKELGLYGRYSTYYVRMSYRNRVLKIYSDDGIEIIIS